MLRDNFYSDETFDILVKHAFVDAEFTDETNPTDNVTYPYINRDLPWPVPDETIQGIENALNRLVDQDSITMFLRASPEGVHCPNVVHNDISMGQYSLMVYLNAKQQCRGGTALVDHYEELTPEVAARDANDPSKWYTTHVAPMWPNRAFIFPAQIMHRAEPVGGFGKAQGGWRMVLTAFFNLQGEA